MFLIQRISRNPLQQMNVVLTDGTIVSLEIYFRPLQQGWFINELTYPTKSFSLEGLRICNSPNMIYQWQNKLPFGLACFSTNNREPSLQDDFSSGSSKLYILSQAEVTAYSEFLKGA